MANTDQFQTVFEQLKNIMQPFEGSLQVQANVPGNYALNTPYVEQLKKEMFFGAVQVKKRYVSYHLMPVYVFPQLLEGISPQLKQRMQGKSCFNFKKIDQETLAELAQLTARGFEQFKQAYSF